MRLHLAEEPETKIVTPPDVQQALNDWRTINENPRMWAAFEAMQFDNGRMVTVIWGSVHSDGTQELPIQTISYRLRKDGTVAVDKYTHP